MGRLKYKSRRRIVVDGVAYRYVVTPNDEFVSLCLRSEQVRGQRLWAAFDYHDRRTIVDGCRSVDGHRLILPGVVRLAVLEGLRQGWNPSASAPALFRLAEGDALLPADEWPRSVPRTH